MPLPLPLLASDCLYTHVYARSNFSYARHACLEKLALDPVVILTSALRLSLNRARSL